MVFSQLNWAREDPVAMQLPEGKTPADAVCMEDPSRQGTARCRMRMAAAQATSLTWAEKPAEKARPIELPPEIVTRDYKAEIDPSTGEIASLFSPSGKTILGRGGGRLQLESPPEKIAKVAADFMAPRRQRTPAADCAAPAAVRAWRGPLATLVEARLDCGAFRAERRIWFYADFPRIDFEIVLELRRSDVLATIAFPFVGRVDRRTRGIPFGFSEGPADEKWMEPQPYFLPRAAEHQLLGYSAAILPALGWSDYRLAGGGGLTLVEDGLPMHELAQDGLTLGLVNAVSTYRGLPNEELRALGRHEFRFGIVPHEGDWRGAESPKRAWEFRAPAMVFEAGRALPPLVRTSGNLILEALRRVDDELEVRLAEWRGEAGAAWVECLAPHREARRTNLLGEEAQPLKRAARYRFAVLPQEIVTLRFRLDSAVERPEPLRSWAPLVPEAKREGLRMRIQKKGHPPRPF